MSLSSGKVVRVQIEGSEDPLEIPTSDFEHVEGPDTTPEDEHETEVDTVVYSGDHENDAGESVHVRLELHVNTTRHTEPGEAQDGSDLLVHDIDSVQVVKTEGIVKDEIDDQPVVDTEELIGESFDELF